MWVVKLGLALQAPDWVRCWLDELSSIGCGRLVIVPGAERRLSLDCLDQLLASPARDLATLSRLAVRALGQEFVALCPDLIACADDAAVAAGLRRAEALPLWLPATTAEAPAGADRALTGLAALAPTWPLGDRLEWMADQLASSLADRWHAERLVLVHAEPPPPVTVQALQLQGARLGRRVQSCGPDDLLRLLDDLLSN